MFEVLIRLCNKTEEIYEKHIVEFLKIYTQTIKVNIILLNDN